MYDNCHHYALQLCSEVVSVNSRSAMHQVEVQHYIYIYMYIAGWCMHNIIATSFIRFHIYIKLPFCCHKAQSPILYIYTCASLYEVEYELNHQMHMVGLSFN